MSSDLERLAELGAPLRRNRFGQIDRRHDIARRVVHPKNDRYRRLLGQRAHRTIVEIRTGMKLPTSAIVHHVDPDDKLTNRGLFVVCQDQAYHALLEVRGRALRECGNPNWRKCKVCGEYDDPANLISRPRRSTATKDRSGHFDYSHVLKRGQCFPKGADVKRCYLAKAKTEGIWEAVEEYRVRCVICGLESSTATFARAAHARVHVADGTARVRVEDAAALFRKPGAIRKVYEPVTGASNVA